jgi:general secretion pathway protein E
MIGEIRDAETAQIAVQASLTGHLVLATLHTNDASSAITRLADMGIEPYLVASSLLGVLAQRLVRRLCPQCAEAETPSAEERALLERLGGRGIERLHRPRGCPACHHTGYAGRTGIYELLGVDEAVRASIHERQGERELRALMAAGGMQSLARDALRWLASGETSLAEVLRVSEAV